MKLFACLASALFIHSLSCAAQGDFRDGDVIFISNKETKGKNLLPNGKSKFNYVGIIFMENDRPMVYHATEPLSKTPVKDFVNLSENQEYKIKNITEEELLTAEMVNKMHAYATARLGSPYDNKLQLSNDLMYNAEFVWKIYEVNLGISLCIPRELKEYKVESPATLEFLTDAYGPAILNEKIVSVGDLFQSQFLE